MSERIFTTIPANLILELKAVNEALVHLQKTVSQGNWGYHPDGPKAAEPAALACLALCAHGLSAQSVPLAKWLANLQTSAGSVGVMEHQETPAWPTSLAILAWLAYENASGTTQFQQSRQKATDWSLEAKGKAAPQQDHIGHDTTIEGWSWADNTHSWLEPTCFFVLALKAAGLNKHPRTRAGVRLIVDRQLETGGCNFGNTRVLYQATVPHIQPTGLAMLALANEPSEDPRIGRSLGYLEKTLSASTATASLCYALIGLSAHGRRPQGADSLLTDALKRDLNAESSNCYKLALLCLASQKHFDQSFLPNGTPPSPPISGNPNPASGPERVQPPTLMQ